MTSSKPYFLTVSRLSGSIKLSNNQRTRGADMTMYNDSYERFLQSQKAAELGLVKDLVRDYGASGSANTYTGSMTAGSNVLTLTEVSDFQAGHGKVDPFAVGDEVYIGLTFVTPNGGETTLSTSVQW